MARPNKRPPKVATPDAPLNGVRVLPFAFGNGRPVVYGLYDEAAPDRIRYVGSTRNLLDRVKKHRAASTTGAPRLRRWIANVQRDNTPVKVIVFAEMPVDVTTAALRAEEGRVIRALADDGHPLLNDRMPSWGEVAA